MLAVRGSLAGCFIRAASSSRLRTVLLQNRCQNASGYTRSGVKICTSTLTPPAPLHVGMFNMWYFRHYLLEYAMLCDIVRLQSTSVCASAKSYKTVLVALFMLFFSTMLTTQSSSMSRSHRYHSDQWARTESSRENTAIPREQYRGLPRRSTSISLQLSKSLVEY